MKYLHLVWAGIWRRPGRATLTLLSIVNAFLLYGLLQGFVSGLGDTVADTHADVLITLSRVSQLEPLPMSHLAQIRATPGVKSAAPLIIFSGAYHTARPANFGGFAVDPDSFVATDTDEAIPPQDIVALKRTRTGVILPARVAAQFNLKVGDRMPVKSLMWTNKDGGAWPLDVVGVYASNPKDLFFGSSILANYDYVDQARTQSTGTASLFVVRVDDPAQAGQVAQRIDAQFANSPDETKTESEQQLVADQIKQIGDIGFVVRAIVGAVFFALLFSVAAVMMQSVRERTPELAVLKTIGFTDTTVLGLILAEALVFCLVSAAIGLGLSALVFPLAKTAVGFRIDVGPVLLAGLGLALLLALISGLPPALRGMRLSIVDALAGR
ncbi:MAG TPA: FtsX-like permease family protein [Caulobacteraceae bacterium]|nr:FtsX-like permease family protein [Caulobacteraceae bacterium]